MRTHVGFKINTVLRVNVMDKTRDDDKYDLKENPLMTSVVLSCPSSHRCRVACSSLHQSSEFTALCFECPWSTDTAYLVRKKEHLLKWVATSGGNTSKYWISGKYDIISLVMLCYPLNLWRDSQHSTNKTYIYDLLSWHPVPCTVTFEFWALIYWGTWEWHLFDHLATIPVTF